MGQFSVTIYGATGSVLSDIQQPMEVLCKTAEIEGVTPHVLRHSYATVAHELGYSELTIAGLLGHRAGSVTGRYVHHVDHALADAADRVAAIIGERIGLVRVISPI